MKTFAQERDFSTDERKKAASSGAAMSDGSYPIETVQDLHNAIQAIGRASNPAAVKAHIKTRAKALGATSAIPDTWESVRIIADHSTALQESAYDSASGKLTVTVIRPGVSKNNRYYSEALLKKAAPIFEGAKMFMDHQTDKEAQSRPEGRVKDWVATLSKVWPESDGTIKGTAIVHDDAFKKNLANLASNGLLNQMGVSIRAVGEAHDGEVNGKKCKMIESLIAARSVDFVTFAGAGGQVDAIESAAPNDGDLWSETILRERRPDLVELIESAVKGKHMEANEGMGYCPPMTADEHEGKAASHQAKADELKAGEKKDAHQQAADDHQDAADAIKKAHKSSALANLHEESSTGNEKGDEMINKQLAAELKEANAKVAALETATAKATAKTELTKLLAEAKLPKVAQDRIEKHFAEAAKTDGMKEMIEAEKEYIKTLGAPIQRNAGAGDNGSPSFEESDKKIGDLKKRQYEAAKSGGASEAEAIAESGYTPAK